MEEINPEQLREAETRAVFMNIAESIGPADLMALLRDAKEVTSRISSPNAGIVIEDSENKFILVIDHESVAFGKGTFYGYNISIEAAEGLIAELQAEKGPDHG